MDAPANRGRGRRRRGLSEGREGRGHKKDLAEGPRAHYRPIHVYKHGTGIARYFVPATTRQDAARE